MEARELADALRGEILPDDDLMAELMAAGECKAVILDTLEHAANHHLWVSRRLLAATRRAINSGDLHPACDADDIACLTADLATLSPNTPV